MGICVRANYPTTFDFTTRAFCTFVMTESQELLHELPKETIRLLGSSQVITSVFSVVKELIENALDAGATSLELRLENYGLDKIEVRDNGSGIPARDVPYVAKKYHTSKITNFSDLENLQTYGFRGEALGSLCSVSSLSITTRTAEEEISSTYSFNYQGQITSSRPSHLGIGTTITALNLFKNLPVRRQFYNTNKKKRDELKRIEDLLLSYGIVSPVLRINLRHDKGIIWQKNPVPDVKTAILETLGKIVSSSLRKKELVIDFPKVGLDLYLPSPECDWSAVARSVNDRGFIFINRRPVHHKEIEKMIRSYMCLEKGRYPVFIVSIKIPSADMDVNVEPNKTRVFLHKQEIILELLENYLKDTYNPLHQSKVQNQILDINMQNSGGNAEGLSRTETIIDPENEVNNVSMVTTDHQVKVIPTKDLSLLDNSLPVFNIPLDKETEEDQELGSVERVALESPTACSDIPKISNTCMPRTLEKESEQPTAEDSSKEALNVRTLNDRDTINVPTVSCDVVTPADPKESSGVTTNTQSSELTDEALSDLMSSWTDNMDTCNTETAVRTPTASVTGDHVKDGPNGEQWSRGQMVKSSIGETIEPVKLLCAGKRPHSPDIGNSPAAKRKSLEVDFDDSSTFSTPQKQNAFKVFAKKMTPKIISENPGYAESRITEMIREGWDNLSMAEKTSYELKAGAANIDKSETKVLNQSLRNKVQKSKFTPAKSIKDQLIRTASRQSTPKETHVPRKEKTVPFNMDKLRQRFSSSLSESQAVSSQWDLIGPLKSCGMWICCHDYKIHILNPHRVHETVLYHRLLRDHILPTEPLEKPITISPGMFGNHWETFRNLASQYRTTEMYPLLRDQRFTSNGIHVKLFFDVNCDVHAELSALSPCIPTYGPEDVKEILDLIDTTGAKSISRSRPLKVINYLKSEAVRMARQLPRQQDFDDMQELLCQVSELLPPGCRTCLHDKPFLYAIYDMSNLPLTQYSQSDEI